VNEFTLHFNVEVFLCSEVLYFRYEVFAVSFYVEFIVAEFY
jgi:hypothetical protein